MSIALPGRMFAPAYRGKAYSTLNLSRAIEEGGTLISPLVPWNAGGAIVITALGLGVADGNFDNLLDLIEKTDPRAFRMVLLQAHYRSPLAVAPDTVEAAEKAVGRLDGVARRAGPVAAEAIAAYDAWIEAIRAGQAIDHDRGHDRAGPPASRDGPGL